MDNKERNQFIDNLLDASLARYGTVSPRPGLEGRVLAHVTARQERHSWHAWVKWLAAGAVATLITVGVIKLMRRLAIPTPPQSVAMAKTTPPTPTIAHHPITVPPERTRPFRRTPYERTRLATPAPAQEEKKWMVFPSPQSLTNQEKLLVQYVRLTPAPVLLASSMDTALIPELEIKLLDIAPLDNEVTESKIN